MLEVIADNTALDFVEDADRNSEAETVRAIVDTLSEPYRSVIKARYFEGLTLQEVGEKLSVSRERARQHEAKALRILGQNKQLRQLWTEQQRHYNWLSLAMFQYSPEYYAVIRRAEEHQLSYGQRQAEIYTVMQNWNGLNP